MLPMWLIAAAASLAFAALWLRRSQMVGSTLTAAWWWAVAAVLVAALAEGAITLSSPLPTATWPASLRYLVAVATLLPVMSVLGAKRPQHRAWQWIVASLWLVLLVAVVQTALFSRGGPLHVHIAWRIFLAMLILKGLVNFGFTRFALPALLLAAGQTALLWPQLPAVRAAHGWPLAGWLLLLAAVVVWSRRVSQPPGARPGLQRLWLVFRNRYGLMWALRVVERFNAAALMYDWPLRLSWEGFTSAQHDGPPPPLAPDVQRQVDTTLRSLLRRFLAPDMIDHELSANAAAHRPPGADTDRQNRPAAAAPSGRCATASPSSASTPGRSVTSD